MSKKFITLTDLVKNSHGWGKEFNDKDGKTGEQRAREWISSPPTEIMNLACLLAIYDVLNGMLKCQDEMLKVSKEYYDQMMKEKRFLEKLKK